MSSVTIQENRTLRALLQTSIAAPALVADTRLATSATVTQFAGEPFLRLFLSVPGKPETSSVADKRHRSQGRASGVHNSQPAVAASGYRCPRIQGLDAACGEARSNVRCQAQLAPCRCSAEDRSGRIRHAVVAPEASVEDHVFCLFCSYFSGVRAFSFSEDFLAWNKDFLARVFCRQAASN